MDLTGNGEIGLALNYRAVFLLSLLLLSALPQLGVARITPNCRDLGKIKGLDLVGDVDEFDVGKDSHGSIVVVYSQERESGGINISLARMEDNGWTYIPVALDLPSNYSTSITFMEDSRGVYWIGYSTFKVLSRPRSDTSELNTTIWLTMSPDRGASWSSPFRAVRYTSLHEYNFGIWDLSLVEDVYGGMWLVWNHVYRRNEDTYYSKSDDMGSSWTEARIFSSEIKYYEGFFTDHLGNLHIIFGDLEYLGRVRLVQLVSTSFGESITWDFSNPIRSLTGIEALTSSVGYAGLFSETGENSTRVWIAWIDSLLEGSGDSWNRNKDLLVLAHSQDAGSTWQLYGYLTVPSTGNPGDEYIAVPRDEENGTEVYVIWLSYEQKLLSYTSISRVAEPSLISAMVILMVLVSRWLYRY